MLTHTKLRDKFAQFWKTKSHKEIPPIPLVPKEDPTTLFTGSGMQQLVPYLLGETHPLGKRLYNIQRGIRTQDIDEVGDNRHTTFFEMMGNWSLGDYFKKEQIVWCWDFLTKEIGLSKSNLFISVFAGTKFIPRDTESISIWKSLGTPQSKIFYYGPDKNWWSRAGIPDNMPVGEPGGITSEVFYEFTQVPHNSKFGPKCHPNCDCGRFLEICNNVFMQYKKEKDGSFSELPNKNVDFGGGLERILAAANENPDVFKIDVLFPIIQKVETLTGKKYGKKFDDTRSMRILSDHIRSAVMLAADGVIPSNKDQGYFLRRLLRRMVRFGKNLGFDKEITVNLVPIVVEIFKKVYKDLPSKQKIIQSLFETEEIKFRNTLNNAQHEVEKFLSRPFSGNKLEEKYAQLAFDLYQSMGYPVEMFIEDVRQRKINLDINKFHTLYKHTFSKHQAVSKEGADKKFKGGLADNSEKTIRYHTATHLLHQALFDVLGNQVRQEGSNITSDRLRFDFSAPKKMSGSELKKVEAIINKKIAEALDVWYKIVPKTEAYKIGARAFFKEKYPEKVKVYFVGGSISSPQTAYSKEFCGGPHVKNTKEIGLVHILKYEKIGSTLYRIYAK
ncbi:hypothetical protein A2866_00615 [Candidatus Roizmanbacteria bacterium RIFCSPHIGHO2_01_FULL_39_8]|uniref:alanine--tRNA ligase n=2 Tax=Candidatus Roizmaniibacteriota TaxID=1752723 RepID=A0A1F7GHL5_9BACT|nr:MAG: hypothetical protein A2866_00615 [Candidatus Roizmanbacteria bacterium RIFCSPHIGHO2_01_FULL_39_8]OGK27653.1 MAG: hypothetical protein A3C28_04705 [Candidatus Roizmanbacteria bacterium RIFCSPHIGHO2_02_FULL_39_9]